MNFIEVYKEQVPYTMQIALPSRLKGGNGTRMYDFTIDYNNTHDFFTLTIEVDEKLLVLSEKMVLNRSLLEDYQDERLPSIDLVMRNRPGQRGEVNYENMGDTVLLMVEGEEDGIMET